MPKAKFIVFFSTKGGVGKTLVSANLALSLRKESSGNICLVDFDLEASMDMSRLLSLSPVKSIADIAVINKEAKDYKPEEFMLKHSSGVELLTGCLRPSQSPRIDQKVIFELLPRLEKKYDYVIIDAGRAFTDSLIGVLSFANLILLVVTPDILSIYQTKWALDVLQSLNFPLKMVKFVLNRSESLGGFPWQDIKAHLPAEIIIHIPSEGRTVGLAVNRCVPVVIDSPKSRFSSAIEKLTQEIINKNKDLFLRRVDLDKLELSK